MNTTSIHLLPCRAYHPVPKALSIDEKMSMPHICTVEHETSRTYLPYKEEDKNVLHRFYRCFRHWCMIWKGHPHFSHYYKSTTVYLEEREAHASSKYFYIIHPISKLCFCIEVFYMFSYIYAFMFYPMLASFQDIHGINYTFSEIEKIFHLIFTMEIIVRLFIGRRNFVHKVVTIDQKKIVRSYLCSFVFIGDICGALPVPYLGQMSNQSSILNYLVIFRMAKILRLGSFVQYCNELFKALKMTTQRGFLNFFIITTICFHWFTCTYYGIHALGGVLRNNYLSTYKWIFQFRAKNVTGAAYIEISFRTMGILLSAKRDTNWSRSVEHNALCFLFGIFGRVLMLVLGVLITNRILRASELSIKYREVLGELNEFINRKKLPPSTRNRLISCYEYKFQGKFVRETKIEKLFSERLKKEINYHSSNKLIKQVSIFEDIPTKILTEIISNLKSEVFLPNDIIISAGAPAECMYFLSTGTVSVTTASGREVCHLQEGSYFGETALIFNHRKSVSSVTALEICETFKLNSKTFKRCFRNNPEIFQKLKAEAERREEESNRLEQEFQEKLFFRTYLRDKRKISLESGVDLYSVSSRRPI